MKASTKFSTYRTVSSAFPSNRIIHERFDEPPRPNMNVFDGERNMPRDAAFDLIGLTFSENLEDLFMQKSYILCSTNRNV